MSGYVYKKPIGKHYRVSIKKWNKSFARRGRWPFVVANIYLQEDSGVVHFNISIFGKLTLMMLSPLIYFVCGFCYGIKETHEDLKGQLFDKKYGRFSCDEIYRNRGDEWEKIQKLIK